MVLKLDIVDADISGRGEEGKLTIVASAPTLGWTNVALNRIEHIMPPEDGLQEYALSGDPPRIPTIPVRQIFRLEAPLPEGDWVRGARIQDSDGKTLLILGQLVRAGPIGDDWVAIEGSGLSGDKLFLDVRYGGGCRPHHFQLAWDGSVEKSDPPRVILDLSHDDHDDPCKALLSDRLHFDLSTELCDPGMHVILLRSNTTERMVHHPRWKPSPAVSARQ